MTVGTPFFDANRAAEPQAGLGRVVRLLWRPPRTPTHHDIEYNAIRQAAALIDVSPLYKYIVSGPDALRLVDRVITRDATKLEVGQVVYTPWCDERGKVIDDGTVARLDETTLPLDGGRPLLPLAADERGRARRRDRATSPRQLGALALQGPRARAVLEARPARTGRTCATSAAAPRRSRGSRSTSPAPATPATSATSCGSPPSARSTVWDALIDGGRRPRPAPGRDPGDGRRPASRPG